MQVDDSAYEPLNRKVATFSLVVATLMMFLAEVAVIRAMWFRPVLHDYGYKRYTDPFLILGPLVLAFAFRIGQKKWIASGGMSSSASSRIGLFLGSFLMVTYICILEVAELAF